MSKENTDFFGSYQEHALTRPRDEAWGNWKSWKGTEAGEKVQGYVVDAFYRPEEKDGETVAFREQRGVTIKQLDGTLVNVGIKYLSYVLSSTDNLRMCDPIVIELKEIKAPAKKGQNGAKVFSYFGTNLPENKDNKSVKELTDEDRNAGGSKEPEVKETIEPDDSDMEALAEEINSEV